MINNYVGTYITWEGKYRSVDNTIGKERGNSYRKNEDIPDERHTEYTEA